MSWDDFERLLAWIVYEAAREATYYMPSFDEGPVYRLFRQRKERWPD